MYIYTLPHIIKRAAQERPEQIGFKYLDKALSYRELHRKSTQLALYLQQRGIQKGERIGIYMPRCLESTIAIYGILKMGGIYVPLDPFAPIDRTAFVIKDCTIKHIVSIPQQARKLKKLVTVTTLTSIIGVAKDIAGCDTTPWQNVFGQITNNFIPPALLESDIAYILYTSGSTGTPKGIMHTHASALAFVKLVTELYEMQDEIYGMHAPLHFDPSVQGYFGGPYAFATTIIVSDAHTKLPASLSELIEKEQITIWFSVPLALVQMLAQGNIESRDFTSLKWVLFSGEVFPTKHLRNLMLVWTFARFSNIYGPTETNQCTYYHVPSVPESDDPIPIGYAWDNTVYKIVDKDDGEVHNGASGELIIRTATMMKGYWNNVDLTQKSFYVETNIAGNEEVYYRTGDQVKINPQGALLFLGRNDYQVKLRGYRIELGEIESVINSLDGVQESAALALKGSNSEDLELITFVVTDNEVILTKESVEDVCHAKLPIYAIPDSIHFIKEFPRTASGKVNRKQLEKILPTL